MGAQSGLGLVGVRLNVPRDTPVWPTVREWCVVGFASALVLLAWYVVGTTQTGLFKDDAAYYARLAESLADPSRLPYTFRLLTPAIVGVIPLDTAAAFALVTLIALEATTLLLNAFLAVNGIQPHARWISVGLFLMSGCVVRALTTPMYVDSVTYALTLAALIVLVRGHDLAFCLLLAVGVTNRETALFLLPSYVLARRSWATGPARLRALAICGAPLLILALVVGVKSSAAGFFGPGVELSAALRYGGASARLPGISDLTDIYSEFGILWLVTLAGVLPVARETRLLLPYAGLVLLQVLIARGDESRILSHSLPLVFLITAREITVMMQSIPIGIPRLALVASFTMSAAMSMIHFRWTFLPWTSARYVLVAVGSVLGLSLIAWHHFSSIVRASRFERNG